jgi:release factor glutamine methyltransferase
MQIKALISEGKAQIETAGYSSIDAEILLAHLLGLTRMELHNPIALERALAEVTDESAIVDGYAELVKRRCNHEPVQYLTGTAGFRNLDLAVGPGVLVPRPETEGLVEEVLKHIANLPGPVSVIDLGAGSGAMAISIATEAPNTHVIAVEKSAEAIEWLKQNVAFYDESIRIVQGDVSDVLEGVKCDVVVANPPYVPDSQPLPKDVANFEPAIALFGGSDGLELPQRFISAAARLLKTGGLLAIEHTETQGAAIAKLLSADFNQIALHQDLTGRPRWTSAIRGDQ